MLENNNWREKFNPSSLNNESWLEPSDKVLGNIENIIYTEKKKKKVALFWPMLFLSLILLLILALSYNAKEINTSERNLEQQPITSPSIGATSQSDQNNLSLSEIEEFSDTETMTKAAKSRALSQNRETYQLSNLNTNANLKTPTPKPSQLNSDAHNASHSTIPPKKGTKDTGIHSSINQSLHIDNSKANITKETILDTAPIKNKSESIIDNGSNLGHPKMMSNEDSRIIDITPVRTIVFKALELKDRTPPTSINNTFLNNDFQAIPPTGHRHYLSVGMSKERAGYTLNQNFASAVSQADFISDDGVGYGIGFEYSRSLTDRWSVVLLSQYSNVSFSSGHNTNFTYDINNESNQSTDVILPIATPLGAMEGYTVVNRSASVTEVETAMVLDLQNTHTYRTFNVGLGIGYRLLDIKGFGVNLQSGLAIQRLYKLQNTLIAVESSDDNFTSSNSRITAKQTSVKKWLPMTSTGVQIEHSVRGKARVGLGYSLWAGLQPLYQEQDFSTDLIRHSIAVYYKMQL